MNRITRVHDSHPRHAYICIETTTESPWSRESDLAAKKVGPCGRDLDHIYPVLVLK